MALFTLPNCAPYTPRHNSAEQHGPTLLFPPQETQTSLLANHFGGVITGESPFCAFIICEIFVGGPKNPKRTLSTNIFSGN